MANTKPRKRGRAPANADAERPATTGEAPPPKSAADQPVGPLRRYIKRYDLPLASPMTFPGFLLYGSVGKHSATARREHRVPRRVAVSAVMEHLQAGVIKEADAISEFLYTVEHKDNEYKLHLGETPREKEPTQ